VARYSEVAKRVGKIADFGHKQGKGFGMRSRTTPYNFSGSTHPGNGLVCQPGDYDRKDFLTLRKIKKTASPLLHSFSLVRGQGRPYGQVCHLLES